MIRSGDARSRVIFTLRRGQMCVRMGLRIASTMFKNMSDTSVCCPVRSWGGKTGYTSEAGHCLASFAQIYDREYIW